MTIAGRCARPKRDFLPKRFAETAFLAHGPYAPNKLTSAVHRRARARATAASIATLPSMNCESVVEEDNLRVIHAGPLHSNCRLPDIAFAASCAHSVLKDKYELSIIISHFNA